MFASLTCSIISFLCLFGTSDSFSADYDRKFAEILPLRAAMLTKNWQGLMLDVEEKVGVVPELGSTSVGTRRDGPELPRRQLCKQQFAFFYDSTFSMALADKNPDPAEAEKKRKTIKSLMMDGKLVGPVSYTYASLTQPVTMSLVVQLPGEWSILSLTVNPTERNMESIIAAESSMLGEVRALAKELGASARLLGKAKESLAGNMEQLGLVPLETNDEEEWFQCS